MGLESRTALRPRPHPWWTARKNLSGNLTFGGRVWKINISKTGKGIIQRQLYGNGYVQFVAKVSVG